MVYSYFYNISAGRFRNLIASVNKFSNLKEKIFIVLWKLKREYDNIYSKGLSRNKSLDFRLQNF